MQARRALYDFSKSNRPHDLQVVLKPICTPVYSLFALHILCFSVQTEHFLPSLGFLIIFQTISLIEF